MNGILSILFILLAGLLLFQISKPVSLIKLNNDLDQFETPEKTPYNKLYGSTTNELPEKLSKKVSCLWDGHNMLYASGPGELGKYGIKQKDSFLDKVDEALKQCKKHDKNNKGTTCINVWPDLGFRCYSSTKLGELRTLEEGHRIDKNGPWVPLIVQAYNTEELSIQEYNFLHNGPLQALKRSFERVYNPNNVRNPMSNSEWDGLVSHESRNLFYLIDHEIDTNIKVVNITWATGDVRSMMNFCFG